VGVAGTPRVLGKKPEKKVGSYGDGSWVDARGQKKVVSGFVNWAILRMAEGTCKEGADGAIQPHSSRNRKGRTGEDHRGRRGGRGVKSCVGFVPLKLPCKGKRIIGEVCSGPDLHFWFQGETEGGEKKLGTLPLDSCVSKDHCGKKRC